LPRNLSWSSVIDLIGHIGDVQPHGNDEFVFAVGSQRRFFKRPSGHNLAVEEISRLRKFLKRAWRSWDACQGISNRTRGGEKQCGRVLNGVSQSPSSRGVSANCSNRDGGSLRFDRGADRGDREEAYWGRHQCRLNTIRADRGLTRLALGLARQPRPAVCFKASLNLPMHTFLVNWRA
jgi:hypothetical protein